MPAVTRTQPQASGSDPPAYDQINTPTFIQQYERTLSGICGTLYTTPPSSGKLVPSFGQEANAYLIAHGYIRESWFDIAGALQRSATEDEFVNLLAPNGTPVAELEYLWSLITRGVHPQYIIL